MKKQLYFFVFVFFFAACSAENSSSEYAQKASPSFTYAPIEESLEVVKGQTVPTSTEALTLKLPTVTTESGKKICLPVRVEQFEQLIGIQYSLKWDPQLLKFESVQNFNLPGLNAANFGSTAAEEGILTSLWIDAQLTGVSLSDESSLYELCFQAIGAAGSEATIRFSNGPTVFEVIQVPENFLRLKYANGVVQITD